MRAQGCMLLLCCCCFIHLLKLARDSTQLELSALAASMYLHVRTHTVIVLACQRLIQLKCSQMSDLWKLVHLARAARRGGHALRMPSDFPRTLRIALFRAATAAAVDALDHDARWERFSPTFNMCVHLP